MSIRVKNHTADIILNTFNIGLYSITKANVL